MERIIVEIINCCLNGTQHVREYEAAFRKYHGTTDAFLYFAQHMYIHIPNMTPKIYNFTTYLFQ
jgi:hypothetical protein